MTDRKIALLAIAIGFIVLTAVASWNTRDGLPTADLLDKAMILAAALLPSPLSKSTITDEVTDANPLPVTPVPPPDADE